MRARGEGSSPGRVEGSSRAMLATATPSCYFSCYMCQRYVTCSWAFFLYFRGDCKWSFQACLSTCISFSQWLWSSEPWWQHHKYRCGYYGYYYYHQPLSGPYCPTTNHNLTLTLLILISPLSVILNPNLSHFGIETKPFTTVNKGTANAWRHVLRKWFLCLWGR